MPPFILEKFLVKLFSKSFERRRLFEKRRHPKTFKTFINRPVPHGTSRSGGYDDAADTAGRDGGAVAQCRAVAAAGPP
ncbi:hypothetical protein C3920_11395 [Novacetimonas pomaceti]|uniref:Uncharacterized protein n=1 Tax=Novacetimonas pomaceti TaxID=2021998 RepID=A0ABX5P061_9PROT|nr:hypothetical protein C3920_11395 [Novacetimonas pomaceti]